ncbi:MAG: hypothetical protein ACO1OO_08875 [Flavisolibacter sp.]
METIFNPTITTSLENTEKLSLIQRFRNYCASQEKNRLMWLGIALAAHGCVLTPVTLMAVLMAGSNFILFIAALVAMGVSLVTHLAAMSTKVTIPVFVFSVLMDVAIIIASISIGFDISSTYI